MPFGREPSRIDIRSVSRPVLLLALGLVAIAAFVAGIVVTGPELTWDSTEYAADARALARGEGRTTPVLAWELVPDVEWRQALPGPWPSLMRPPLPVTIIASFFRVFGLSDLTFVLWSGAFYVATVLLLFAVAESWFGRAVGLWSALVFALSRCGLVYARSGLTESAAMFLVLAAVALVLHDDRRRTWFAAGLLFALCALIRPIAHVSFAVTIVYELVARRPGARARSFAAALGWSVPVVASHLMGWPESRALATINVAAHVGDTWAAIDNPARYVFTHARGYAYKIAHEIGRALVYMFQIGGIWLFSPLSLLGLLVPPRSAVEGRRRALVVALLVGTTLALAGLTVGDAMVGPLRYYDIFTPLLLPFGVHTLSRLCEPSIGVSARAFALAMALYLAGSAFQAIRDPFPFTPPVRAIAGDLAAEVPADEVIGASEFVVPPAVSWYADRRVLMLPPDATETLGRVARSGLAIHWFLLGERDAAPPGCRVVRSWPGGFVLYRR